MLGVVNVSGPQVFSLEFTPYRSQGILEGCGYAYEVILRDWAYRSNKPTIAYGSVVAFLYQGKPAALSHRIGLTDIEQRDNALWQRNSSVHYAYLSRGTRSTAGMEHKAFDGEDGVRVFTYVDPQLEMIYWLLLDPDPFTIAFNRTPNATDLEFKIPTRLHLDVWKAFAECLVELVKRQK
jgi:hypothetical protein